jgi:hypothetical protein
VSLILLEPPQRIQLCKLGLKSYCISGGIDTAGSIWNRCFWGPRVREALAALKGNINKKKLHRQIGSSSVIDTAGAKIGDFKVEYLREFEVICKMALTSESGAKVQCVKFSGKKI